MKRYILNNMHIILAIIGVALSLFLSFNESFIMALAVEARNAMFTWITAFIICASLVGIVLSVYRIIHFRKMKALAIIALIVNSIVLSFTILILIVANIGGV